MMYFERGTVAYLAQRLSKMAKRAGGANRRCIASLLEGLAELPPSTRVQVQYGCGVTRGGEAWAHDVVMVAG